MYVSKLYISVIAGCFILLAASCRIKSLPFDFKDQTSKYAPQFFAELPAISKGFDVDPALVGFDTIRSCEVYRSTFTEKWVESTNLVEFALLNDRDTRQAAYDNGTRNKYAMYILVLNTDKVSSDTTSKTIEHRQPCLFFTEQQNTASKCIGFGPVYFGVMQTSINRVTSTTTTRIGFQRLLCMSYHKKSSCYVLEKGKNLVKDGNMLMYMLSKMPVQQQDKVFNIDKIVLPPANHLGGSKRVVIEVDSVMGQGLSLPFNYVSTINY